ncbi:MAG: hypothetical protein AB7W59_00365 [Acidimicrobiia bacterium]
MDQQALADLRSWQRFQEDKMAKTFKRVSDHVIDSMLAEAEGSNSVLERLCEEVKMARSARASEVTGVAGRVVLEMVADSPYMPLSRKDAVAAAMEALAEEAGDKSPLEGGN